jgi:hypothetical protein
MGFAKGEEQDVSQAYVNHLLSRRPAGTAHANQDPLGSNFSDRLFLLGLIMGDLAAGELH